MNDSNTLSIIIPIYNEENSVEQTINSILSKISQKTEECENIQIIAVNDGSTDGTSNILRNIKNKQLKLIDRKENLGYGYSIKQGVDNAESTFIAIIDADGSYPIDEVINLYHECLNGDYDMVIGSRTGKNVEYSKIRAIPKFFLKRYAEYIIGQKISDLNSGLRVFKKNFFEIYKFIIPNGFSLTTTITLSGLINEHRVRFIPIDYYSRAGKSKIRPIQDTVNFFKIIMRIGLYYQPKKVFGPVNIFFFISFILSVSFDIFVEFNISDKTVLLLNTLLTMIAFTFIAELITRKDVKR